MRIRTVNALRSKMLWIVNNSPIEDLPLTQVQSFDAWVAQLGVRWATARMPALVSDAERTIRLLNANGGWLILSDRWLFERQAKLKLPSLCWSTQGAVRDSLHKLRSDGLGDNIAETLEVLAGLSGLEPAGNTTLNELEPLLVHILIRVPSHSGWSIFSDPILRRILSHNPAGLATAQVKFDGQRCKAVQLLFTGSLQDALSAAVRDIGAPVTRIDLHTEDGLLQWGVPPGQQLRMIETDAQINIHSAPFNVGLADVLLSDAAA